MPLRLSAMFALAAAIGLAILVFSRGRRSAPVPEEKDQPDLDEIVDRPARSTTSRLRTRPQQTPMEPGLSVVSGRLLAPAGMALPPDDEMEVTAAVGSRRLDAQVEADGTFQLHLTPGTLDLRARAGDLVGALDGVVAIAGAHREVTITLAPGAAIRGVIRRRTGVEAPALVVARAGDGREGDEVDDVTDDFELTGLLPGVRYDLQVTSSDARPVEIPGVLAPAEGLMVMLEPAPMLRGAIGLDRRGNCPIRIVEVKTSDEEGHGETVDVDRRCRFETSLLQPPGSRLRVEATGAGWHLATHVNVPVRGDPPELCLNPPCGMPAPPRGTIEVEVKGLSGPLRARSRGRGHDAACAGSSACVLEDVPLGVPVDVNVRAEHCGAWPSQRVVVPHAGARTRVQLTCQRMRDVIAILRGPRADLFVRCGEREQFLSDRKTVALLCPSDATRLEYRRGDDRDWRSVTIPPGPPDDTAIVEMSLR